MKVTLIQIDLVLGSRVLLSLLLEKGYEVKSLQIDIKYTELLSDDDLEHIFDYVAGSDVVGLSFNTFYALVAEQLAHYLRKKGIKYIVAGGNHATALPEEVIAYSDVVVKYEAEITLPKVLSALKCGGEGLSNIKGIVYKSDGRLFHNAEAPDIVWELDTLPPQSIDTDLIRYFNSKNKVYTPDKKELFPHGGNSYFILASRGCPFNCTYCSNSLYHKLDDRFRKVRKRSINNILDEMDIAVANGFESFYITDDHFFSFTVEEIRHFNSEYKKRISKPFSVVGINPSNFRSSSAEIKLSLLIDCGLSEIRIGIQSGSNGTLERFKRSYRAEDIPELLKPIEKYRKTIWNSPHDRLHVALDFICDAVWETEDDKIDTIKLAQRVLTQYSIFFYTLVYLPGTEIYNLAIKNGWIASKESDIYLRGIAGVDDNIYNRILFSTAVAKERGITFPDGLIDHILDVYHKDQGLAECIIDFIIDSINGTEKHHGISLTHATLHPYLTGFNKWSKTSGEKGRKVLFRSYHEPYG